MTEPNWRIKIAGVGRYLPKRIVPSSEVEAMCNIPEGVSVKRSGVHERRWADIEGGETATWMGTQAALEALDEAELKPSDLDLIINASATPEQAIPDGGCLIQRHLGLEESGIMCMSVHTTCLSFVCALDVAAAFMKTGRHKNILIVSSDLASPGLNFEEAESATLFGDMSAAAVLVPTPEGESSGMHKMIFETYSSGADLTVIRGGGTAIHPNSPRSTPEAHCFAMKGPDVLKFAFRLMPPFVSRLCEKHDPQVDLVIPHQSSKVGLAAAAKIFKQYANISEDKIVNVLEKYGNCVAASIPSTLYEAIRSGRLKRGDRFIMAGTGAGLSLAGAVLTY